MLHKNEIRALISEALEGEKKYMEKLTEQNDLDITFAPFHRISDVLIRMAEKRPQLAEQEFIVHVASSGGFMKTPVITELLRLLSVNNFFDHEWAEKLMSPEAIQTLDWCLGQDWCPDTPSKFMQIAETFRQATLRNIEKLLTELPNTGQFKDIYALYPVRDFVKDMDIDSQCIHSYVENLIPIYKATVKHLQFI